MWTLVHSYADMSDNKQEGTVSRRPSTAADRVWGEQCQDCKPHGGIQGKATQRTHTTQRRDLGFRCHMHRQYLQEGKTQKRWTEPKQRILLKTGAGQGRAVQAGQPGQEHTGPPVTAGMVTVTTGDKIDKGELSSHQRRLHMSGNLIRQHMWEGVCMLKIPWAFSPSLCGTMGLGFM